MSDPHAAVPRGYRLIELGDTGSTNTEALAAFDEGDPGHLWITAARQLAGRGRRDRSWVSEPGNLYASLLLVDPAPAAQLGTLPLLVALALHTAIEKTTGGSGGALRIKWPNDLLLGGRKLSGILLESRKDKAGRLGVVIGCGVNCAHFPTGNAAYAATSLVACGYAVTPAQLFGDFAAMLDRMLSHWLNEGSFLPFRRQWLDAAAGLGAPIRVDMGSQILEGVFDDLDAGGYLIVRRPDGSRQRIVAGDLFFAGGRQS